MRSCGRPRRASPLTRVAPVAEPIRWPAEHIVLRTVDGRTVIERLVDAKLPGGQVIARGLWETDARPYTGWERARRTQLPRATPAAGD